jgi:transcription elongation factor GreA
LVDTVSEGLLIIPVLIMKYTYLTHGGYEKLISELEDLKTNGRDEMAKAIAEARDKGDLSENAEYIAAKEAQGMLELRINKLEQVLLNARIIDQSQIDTSVVSLLSRVTIKNVKTGRQVTYQLVSESEANLKEKKLSSRSPIGEGLLGKKVGDVAAIKTPGGLTQFEILNITID